MLRSMSFSARLGALDTPDIRVQVGVRYHGTSVDREEVFQYFVHIENASDESWQLRTRHWEITDAQGSVTVVDGEGVVGEQPLLPPSGVFVYDSYVMLRHAPGHMRGFYTFYNAWNQQAKIDIPVFVLNATRTMPN